MPAIGRLWAQPVARGAVAAGALALGLWIFRRVQLAVEPRMRLLTPFDAAIPFLPWTVWIYAAFVLFAIAAIALAPPRRALAALLASAGALALALPCFALLPADLPRPPAPPGISGAAIDWLRRHDDAHNTCPSLHVALAVTAAWAVAPTRWRWAAIGCAAAISLSTLTVKQHTVVDVVAGALLGLVTCAVAGRLRGVERDRSGAQPT